MKSIAASQAIVSHKSLTVALVCLLGTLTVSAQTNRPGGFSRSRSANDPIARIKDEGMNHSQVMQTLSYLTDVIGPRLTGSPNMKRANEWTREKLQSWGLSNACLEAWGPFGYGWTLESFSAQVTSPQNIPLKAYPSAWSPGLKSPVTADVIFLDATNTTQLEKYKGKLKGAIILASPVREVPPRVEPPSRRLDVTNLLDLANASAADPVFPSGNPTPFRGQRFGEGRGDTNSPPFGRFGGGTNSFRQFAGTNAPPFGRRRGASWTRFIPFLNEEGVAAVLIPSSQGDAGTIFVASASLPPTDGDTGTNSNALADVPRSTGGRSAYSTNAPTIPPQITVAVEDYNRLVRMVQQDEKLKMNLDLKVKFHRDDVMSYNTVAEIPGSDLKDEVVMIGAHMDSWHSGTGATDNGVGCAAAMEAVRIIKALDLKPRRTIRIALWSGEEEGLLGSKAYVAKHFGRFETNSTERSSSTVRSPKDSDSDERPSRSGRSRSGSGRKLVKEDEYDKFSAYYNLDNGAGKIRGIFMQGNEAVRPYFRKWLEPFRDLGAETLTPSNTGSTDHISFNNVGLPGFQFIQDPLDYFTRTHHSNEDVYDRVQPEDLKQASVIMAAFIYNTAMLDEKLPRKPLDEERRILP